jgi:uncharacterized protein (TIGR02145 family)
MFSALTYYNKMKKIIFLLIVFVFVFCSQNEDNTNQNDSIPELTTTPVFSITLNSAFAGGNITSDGGFEITARGLVWNTTTNPTISLPTKTTNGSGIEFYGQMINLLPNTTYYVRAYATNSSGTAYGNELSFTTGAVQLPTLSTISITNITSTTANSGGTISSDGGGTISERGVVWSTSQNPTINLTTKTTNGSGVGNFVSNISGLLSGTNYYIRAYATNVAGTSYGNQLTFTTSSTAINVPGPILTDIDGNIYQSITNCNQTWTIQNLNVSKFTDGTPIPQATTAVQWETAGPAWCYYQNNTANGTTYGKLYNWYAVAGIYYNASLNDPALRKKLAPSGWHIPTDDEWDVLMDCLGGVNVGGGKMKEIGTTHWVSPNTDATNSSGFLALPGSWRNVDGTFSNDIGGKGYWWSSTQIGPVLSGSGSPIRYLAYNSGGGPLRLLQAHKKGFSVRCIKD